MAGNVRIDDRDSLARSLGATPGSTEDWSDKQLLLSAYQQWGSQCLDRISGDFAFVLVDKQQRHALLARDFFGVEPLYYIRKGNTLAASNSIRWLKDRPEFSEGLNQSAIMDFLAFGYNLDQGRTFFQSIERLPPASALTLEPNGHVSRQTTDGIRCRNLVLGKNIDFYTEGLLHHLGEAISDRLRSRNVAFELSGGLDSTTVAALATGQLRKTGDFRGLAITTSFSDIDEADQEGLLARQVTDWLGLQHDVIQTGKTDDFLAETGTDQPFAWPFSSVARRTGERIGKEYNILLSGQGGDPFLLGSGQPLTDLQREGGWINLLKHTVQQGIRHRSLRRLGLRSLFGRSQPLHKMPPIPGWLRPSPLLEESIERWNHHFLFPPGFPVDCQSEFAYAQLKIPFWSHLFEEYYHQFFENLDSRHPFFDKRVIEFLLTVPPSVKLDKKVLRLAAREYLPKEINTREKAVVESDLVQRQLNRRDTRSMSQTLDQSLRWVDPHHYGISLEEYKNGDRLFQYQEVRPLILEGWFDHQAVIS